MPVDGRPAIPLSQQALLWFVMAVPCAVFLYVAADYALNLPFYDDFSVILAQVIAFLGTDHFAWAEREILAVNAGHIPFLTRFVALMQVYWIGGINFRWLVILGNAGWVLMALAMARHFRKTLDLPLYVLLPVPFFLMSLLHWESMDFSVPAWQFYWGATLLPVLCFIAIVEGYPLLASLAFALAIFTSAGSIAIYPLVVGYCLVRQYWERTTLFTVFAGLALAYFFKLNPPVRNLTESPELLFVLKYIVAFMGNLYANGEWDMHAYQTLHLVLGAGVIAAGVLAFLFIGRERGDFSKLVFVYVLLLGGMAAYLRGGGYDYVVPRYSSFALLSMTSLYVVWMSVWARTARPARLKGVTVACLVLALYVWGNSLLTCRAPLDANKQTWEDGMRNYLQHGDPSLLVWKAEYAILQLQNAKALGVYDAEVMRPQLLGAGAAPGH